jgi:AbrB family looped-hinge helix DNA binding protein
MGGPFRDRIYGAVTVGERGQLVIPAQLRKALNIKSGDQLIVFAKADKKMINLVPSKDFTEFLNKAEKFFSRLREKVKT